ncbi:MAG: ammonia-forming cytochrome c nitrite reductase subunit c552 [candidate division Zixibacteria bacterium]|jgi:hypothetical protein|nr:ammonia-forming cytochrome c nitrite reductase subunit c552 [candidate division Zixibacteria bacterium]
MRILRILSIIVLIAMLAVIAGCERKVVNEANNDNQGLSGCFGCHGEEAFGGAILQAQGEWQNSIHASGNNIDYTNRDKSDCMMCHDQQGFLDMLNTGTLDTLRYSVVSGIHCFTCHAPHENGNLQLRTEAPYALRNGVVFDHGAANICVRCHHTREPLDVTLGTADSVTLTSRMGPHHGPQGDMLQGTLGYQFSGYTYPTASQHGGATVDGCLDCHMGNPQQHDGYRVGGHSFNMTYFDDEAGTEYTLSGVCKNCHPAADSLNYNLKGVDYNNNGAVEGIQTELQGLRDTLQIWLKAAGALTENGTTHVFSIKSTKVPRNVAGAVYNWVLFNEDRSWGVHNPQYLYHLLKSSVDYMKAHQ